MGKKSYDKKNWILEGGLWYNFHEYHYDSGDVLVVVRGPTKYRGNYTRKIKGKFVIKPNGFAREMRRDSVWQDEDSDSWIDWRTLLDWYKDATGWKKVYL